MSQTIRSFIAFDLENPSILEQISKTQNQLTQTGANLKLVKPRNVHVTLRFLGNVTQNMVNQIYEKMKKVSFKPFDIEIQGVGVFPKPTHIRVIWIGVRKGADELVNIFNQLEPQLQSLGFKPDRKGFTPHLTIARVKGSRHKTELIKRIRELSDQKFGVVKGKCLRLKKSVLTPKGPIYSILKEVCP
ncbi:MAG: RNA 2',3'-cyclic phosphodiesterase [Thermoproteota archaeon]|nr:RNA 2',3'-cyclic phosphodiesterase [Thermoproteota archaeon]